MPFSIAFAIASSRLPLCSMTSNTTISSSISFSTFMYFSISTSCFEIMPSLKHKFFSSPLHSSTYVRFRNCASSSIGGNFRQS
jgi:hypothetical protein